MTRISKKKKESLLSNYKVYKFCVEQYEQDGDTHMHEIYKARLEEIISILNILEIKIDGINS